MGIGDWGLGIGDWGLGIGVLAACVDSELPHRSGSVTGPTEATLFLSSL
ncbi:hypothetical protein JYQ62_23960 [Nostoc sp. UHCC 0702]|nr:hypothetical protein JYQ62_23960 [Nostoc sp. UHCC 0702]